MVAVVTAPQAEPCQIISAGLEIRGSLYSATHPDTTDDLGDGLDLGVVEGVGGRIDVDTVCSISTIMRYHQSD